MSSDTLIALVLLGVIALIVIANIIGSRRDKNWWT